MENYKNYRKASNDRAVLRRENALTALDRAIFIAEKVEERREALKKRTTYLDLKIGAILDEIQKIKVEWGMV